jgi:hypothetical protein
MKNYEKLLHKISTWMHAESLLFIHIFCHKTFAYNFEVKNWLLFRDMVINKIRGQEDFPLFTTCDNSRLSFMNGSLAKNDICLLWSHAIWYVSRLTNNGKLLHRETLIFLMPFDISLCNSAILIFSLFISRTAGYILVTSFNNVMWLGIWWGWLDGKIFFYWRYHASCRIAALFPGMWHISSHNQMQMLWSSGCPNSDSDNHGTLYS